MPKADDFELDKVRRVIFPVLNSSHSKEKLEKKFKNLKSKIRRPTVKKHTKILI